MLRNACLVLGNSGDRQVVAALCRAIEDHDPLIRGAAAWALGRIGGAAAVRALESRAVVEDTAAVRVEIQSAIHQMHTHQDG